MPPGQEKTATRKSAKPRLEPGSEPDLSIFCDPESIRYRLAEPFVHAGWKYATDGRICVRVPAKKGEKDTPERNGQGYRIIPRVWELFADFDAFVADRCTLDWSDFYAEVKATAIEIECETCHGRKLLQVECDQCSGEGNRPPVSGSRKLRNCGPCDGKGVVSNSEGKPCPDCLGAGKVWEPMIARGTDVKLAGGYIAKVSTLADVRYCGAGSQYVGSKFGEMYAHDQIAFVFAAGRPGSRKVGQGFLMGLLRDGR